MNTKKILEYITREPNSKDEGVLTYVQASIESTGGSFSTPPRISQRLVKDFGGKPYLVMVIAID